MYHGHKSIQHVSQGLISTFTLLNGDKCTSLKIEKLFSSDSLKSPLSPTFPPLP